MKKQNNMKEKPFEELEGNRVLVKLPSIPDSSIHLSEEVKQSLLESQKEKLNKLEIYAVGTTVSNFSEGDIVKVDPRALGNGELIKLEKGLEVVMISSFDISIVWKRKK